MHTDIREFDERGADATQLGLYYQREYRQGASYEDERPRNVQRDVQRDVQREEGRADPMERQHIYNEQYQYTENNGIPPPLAFNSNNRHFNSEYNRGFNAGYVRGHYIAMSRMNQPEGHRMYQRYSSRWANRGEHRPYRGRGRPNRDHFTTTSGQQVQLLQHVNIPVQHETSHETSHEAPREAPHEGSYEP